MWNTSPELKNDHEMALRDRKSSFQSLFPYQPRRIVTVNPNTPIITPTNSVIPVTPSNPVTPVTSTNNVVNPVNKVTPTNPPIIDSSIDPTNVTSEPIPIDEFLEFSP